jgi:hypothetical protein
MTNKIFNEPYFSSSIGPTTSKSMIFPIKWLQPACPNTCPISLTYVRGLKSDERYTLKMAYVDALFVSLPNMRAIKQIAVKPNITGELNDTLNLMFLTLFLSIKYLLVKSIN